MLYDASTLYFATDEGDGFREPEFFKERRLDPQITIGMPEVCTNLSQVRHESGSSPWVCGVEVAQSDHIHAGHEVSDCSSVNGGAP